MSYEDDEKKKSLLDKAKELMERQKPEVEGAISRVFEPAKKRADTFGKPPGEDSGPKVDPSEQEKMQQKMNANAERALQERRRQKTAMAIWQRTQAERNK